MSRVLCFKRRIIRQPGILRVIYVLLAALCISATGCSGGSDVGNPQTFTFASDDALRAYLVDQFSQGALPDTLRTEKSNDAEMPAPGLSDEAGYSQTNVQETGVDESDKAKTDGRFIFTTGDREIRITDTHAGALKPVSRMEIKGHVDSLYLYGSTLIVLYTPENGAGDSWSGKDEFGAADIRMDMGMPYWIPVNAEIGIRIIDVTDPETPLTLKDFQMDGYLVSSRLTGGRLHVVSQFFPDIPRIDVWYDGSAEDRAAASDANKRTLADLTLDDMIPGFQEFDDAGFMTDTGRLVATKDFLRPENPDGGSIVSITTVDMQDLSHEIESVGFIADVHHVYASTQNLYLVSTAYNMMPLMERAAMAMENETRIYRFDLTAPTVAYAAFGTVPGRVLNQFSLGEYEDVLRIATSTGNTWDGSAENHVFCLMKEDETLTIIGRLEGLVPGERLYASRFIGDKGFLVTFVEIDPLFTLDLSDPRDPKAVGELKVPGYSTYIHPLGADYLLTIGKDSIFENGSIWYQGLQLSIFDIRDFADPKLIATQKIGDRGTESEALYNHKAFTFWADQNLLALPVDLHEYAKPPAVPWQYADRTFYGLYIYRITEDLRFDDAGRIDMMPDNGGPYFYPDWLRGIFIDQNVYAVAADRVRGADIASGDKSF